MAVDTAYSQNGKPIDLATGRLSTQVIEGEIGSQDPHPSLYFPVRYEAGKIFELPDYKPEEFDTMLKLDGQARKLEQVLTLPVRFAEWHLDPATKDRGEAKLCQEVIDNLETPIDLVIAQAAASCIYRRAFFERVWQANSGMAVYSKLAWRPSSSCIVRRDADTGALLGFTQRIWRPQGGIDEVEIKLLKTLLFVHGQHRDPIHGISDLDTTLALFQSKQKVRFLWYSFLETQAMPKAIARDSSNDPTQIQALAKKVATLKGGGVVGIGEGQAVDAYYAQTEGKAFVECMHYLDAEMSGSILAGFLDLVVGTSSQGRGSYALSQDQSELFLKSRQAVLSELAATFRQQVLRDLCVVNMGPDARVPRWVFAPLSDQSGQQAVDVLKALATAQTVNPGIPAEFLSLLVEKVAALLSLDVERVRDAIEKGTTGSPTQQLVTGIDNAARLVREAGLTQPAAG